MTHENKINRLMAEEKNLTDNRESALTLASDLLERQLVPCIAYSQRPVFQITTEKGRL